MPISVVCPACGRSAAVPDSAVGRNVRCACGTSFPVKSEVAVGGDFVLEPLQSDRVPSDDPQPRTQKIGDNAKKRLPRQGAGKTSRSVDAPKNPTGASRQTYLFLGMIILGVAFILKISSGKSPAIVKDQPAASTPPSPAQASSDRRKKAIALDEINHQFERTDASIHLNKDDVRALIYVTMKTMPENRQIEALNDLLTVAHFAPYSYKGLRNYESSFFLTDDFMRQSNGVRQNFIVIFEAYCAASKDAKKRGTTIEAEARKVLSD